MDESNGLLNRRRLTPYPGFESRPLRIRRILGGGFVFLALCVAVAAPARAQNPTEQYLAQRRASGWRYDVTLSQVVQSPDRYRDQAFEIEGKLTGMARNDDGGALLLLSETPVGSLSLSMSAVPVWLQPGSRIRVLTHVVPPEEGAIVIGLPELVVIAVASAADVGAAEERWRQSKAAEAQRQAAARARSQASTNRSGLPSRSGATRPGVPTMAAPRLSELSPAAAAVFPAYQAYIQKHNKRLQPDQAGAITYAILRFSEAYDLDPRLVVATVIAESDFRITETSNKGAMGLIQLMPDEVRRLRLSNPYDPVENIAGGVFLIKERLNRYSRSPNFKDATTDHIILALASYNAGMGAVKKYGGVPPYRETRGYVAKIMRIYRELCAGDNS